MSTFLPAGSARRSGANPRPLRRSSVSNASSSGPSGAASSSLSLQNSSSVNVGLDVVISQRSYFAGDVVKCRIYFYFPDSLRESVFLEWASAQIHGHVAFDPHLVSPRDAELVAEAADAGHLDFEDREKRLRRAHETTSVLHRAEEGMQVIRRTKSEVRVGRRNDHHNPRAGDVNQAGHDGYEATMDFLSQTASVPMPRMPDVTLLAGKYGSCIFSSPPEVFACALEGRPGREMAFAFEAQLPTELPPSYRGCAARYFYVLSVGTKLGHHETAQVLHVPIRLCSTIEPEDDTIQGASNGSSDGNLVTRPGSSLSTGKDRMRSFSSFIVEEHNFNVRSYILGETRFRRKMAPGSDESFRVASDDLPLNVRPGAVGLKVVDFDCTGIALEERASQYAPAAGDETPSSARHRSPSDSDFGDEEDTAAAGGGARVFRIGSEARHMALLHMFREAVRPGDQLLMSFDFAHADVNCYQITVALELEERSKCPPSLQAALDPLTDAHGFGMGPWQRILTSRTVQVGFNLQRSIIMTVPVDATPDFETDLISVRSYLRFSFVTAKDRDPGTSWDGPGTVQGGLPITNSRTQTSPWRIPLKILPPFDRHAKQKASIRVKQVASAIETDGVASSSAPTSVSPENGYDSGILMLSSSTQSSMLHVHVLI